MLGYLTVFESEQNMTHKPTWATSITAMKRHMMANTGNGGMAPLITLGNETRYQLNRRHVWAPEMICMSPGKQKSLRAAKYFLENLEVESFEFATPHLRIP
jgi:hypothetical protein